jgi:hypothetical protein
MILPLTTKWPFFTVTKFGGGSFLLKWLGSSVSAFRELKFNKPNFARNKNKMMKITAQIILNIFKLFKFQNWISWVKSL